MARRFLVDRRCEILSDAFCVLVVAQKSSSVPPAIAVSITAPTGARALLAAGWSLKEANRRYNASAGGRHAHAERSRRYRERRKSVTDHGSLFPSECAVLSASATNVAEESLIDDISSVRRVHQCHFCRRWYGPWIRHAPLRRRSSRLDYDRRERL